MHMKAASEYAWSGIGGGREGHKSINRTLKGNVRKSRTVAGERRRFVNEYREWVEKEMGNERGRAPRIADAYGVSEAALGAHWRRIQQDEAEYIKTATGCAQFVRRYLEKKQEREQNG